MTKLTGELLEDETSGGTKSQAGESFLLRAEPDSEREYNNITLQMSNSVLEAECDDTKQQNQSATAIQ